MAKVFPQSWMIEAAKLGEHYRRYERSIFSSLNALRRAGRAVSLPIPRKPKDSAEAAIQGAQLVRKGRVVMAMRPALKDAHGHPTREAMQFALWSGTIPENFREVRSLYWAGKRIIKATS